jgi:hypothetical protein
MPTQPDQTSAAAAAGTARTSSGSGRTAPARLGLLLGELLEVSGQPGALLTQGSSQQFQISARAGEYLAEFLQPGGHGGPASLDGRMVCLGLLDPFVDQGRLVGASGRERLEREPLRFLCFSFPGSCFLQILGGLCQPKTHVVLAGTGPVQNLSGVPHS